MDDLPLVLIGGWGVPVTAVAPLAGQWQGPVISHSLDDGHLCGGMMPDELVQSWLQAVGGPAVWAGWSLGGQLAMRAAALAPAKVAGVFTCCSTPRFLSGEGWDLGMSRPEFEAFRSGVARQTSRFWKRFLLLQVHGDAHEAAGRRAWKPWLDGELPYSRETLLTGLDWLATLDERSAWANTDLPHQHIFGENDRVVDPQVAQALDRMGCHLQVIKGMAHFPFGDYAEELARQLALFGDRVWRDNSP